MRLVIAALVAAFSCLPAVAANHHNHPSHNPPSPHSAAPSDAPALQSFDELFAPLHEGGCIKIDAVRAAGATVTLTPEQFQFVRAFWMAIPPVSRTLPPGDHAFLAKDKDGQAMLGLYDEDDGQVCGVFRADDWMLKLVDEIGRGETGKRGEDL